MLDAMTSSLVLPAIIVLGYLLKRRGIIRQEHRKLLLILILNVTMPCAIIAGFDMELKIGELLTPFLLGCGACLLLNLAAVLFTRGRSGQTRALTLLMTCGFMVAPFLIPFAQTSMPHAFMVIAAFDVAQSLFNMGFNYISASLLARSSQHLSPFALLRNLLRPGPLTTYLCLLVISALGLRIPAFALAFADKVGSACVFLSMIFIGLVLDLNLERETVRQVGRIVLIRYGVIALVGLACFFALRIDTLFAKVVILGLMAPVSNASMAYSESLGCDSKAYGAVSSISFVAAIAAYALLPILWG